MNDDMSQPPWTSRSDVSTLTEMEENNPQCKKKINASNIVCSKIHNTYAAPPAPSPAT